MKIKPVRGTVYDDGYISYRRIMPSGRVTILPHSGEAVGPFKKRMLKRNTDARNINGNQGGWVAIPREDYDELRAAIASLFEELDHE